PLALAIDQLVRIASEARWAGRVLLAAGIAINAGALRTSAASWAIASRNEKDTFELIMGTPEVLTVDPHTIP
ncbi:MAG TPA: hypothetical protein VGM78_16155, partial [Ilumatobacteraceae bacterium]